MIRSRRIMHLSRTMPVFQSKYTTNISGRLLVPCGSRSHTYVGEPQIKKGQSSYSCLISRFLSANHIRFGHSRTVVKESAFQFQSYNSIF